MLLSTNQEVCGSFGAVLDAPPKHDLQVLSGVLEAAATDAAGVQKATLFEVCEKKCLGIFLTRIVL